LGVCVRRGWVGEEEEGVGRGPRYAASRSLRTSFVSFHTTAISATVLTEERRRERSASAFGSDADGSRARLVCCSAATTPDTSFCAAEFR
jgi:hypothetical protein